MPENHPTDSRTLVVQVKAQNPQGFAAIDQVRITLYKAQDRPPDEYRDLIDAEATTAANDVGVDVETFKSYMKAILCQESQWRGYTGYCAPLVGADGHGRGIAQMDDRTWKAGKQVEDPRGGVLFGKIDEKQRNYNPFYGIRFAAKYLSKFFLRMNRERRFRGLTETQRFQNAVIMYNAGEGRTIWTTDPDAAEYEYENDRLTRLVADNPKLVENMFNYLGRINNWRENPCY